MKAKLFQGPFLRVPLIAVGASLAGYVTYPLFAGFEWAPQTLWSGGVAAGALIGSLLTAVRSPRSAGGASKTSGSLKTVFVGNLSFKASDDDLKSLFGRYGQVHSVRIMTDRATRRPRGFGFVEMEGSAANSAIKALDGKPLHGRELRVNEGKKTAGGERRTG